MRSRWDGASAIGNYIVAKSKSEPFDIVFMDLTVPGGMGGTDAIEALRKIDPEVVAVVVSGYSNAPAMSNFLEYGFRVRLDKPFKMQDLARLRNKLMKGRKPGILKPHTPLPSPPQSGPPTIRNEVSFEAGERINEDVQS